MLKISVTKNINGQSIIESGNEQKQVAYMNATINEDKNVNINKSIQDMKLFEANKVAVQADFTEFETRVYEMCAQVSSELTK